MSKFFKKLFFWFDNSFLEEKYASITNGKEIDWMRVIPFILLHLSCLLIFVVGFSWIAFIVCISLFAIRMFAITGFYHRYFSHKTFKTKAIYQTKSSSTPSAGCTEFHQLIDSNGNQKHNKCTTANNHGKLVHLLFFLFGFLFSPL